MAEGNEFTHSICEQLSGWIHITCDGNSYIAHTHIKSECCSITLLHTKCYYEVNVFVLNSDNVNRKDDNISA